MVTYMHTCMHTHTNAQTCTLTHMHTHINTTHSHTLTHKHTHRFLLLPGSLCYGGFCQARIPARNKFTVNSSPAHTCQDLEAFPGNWKPGATAPLEAQREGTFYLMGCILPLGSATDCHGHPCRRLAGSGLSRLPPPHRPHQGPQALYPLGSHSCLASETPPPSPWLCSVAVLG